MTAPPSDSCRQPASAPAFSNRQLIGRLLRVAWQYRRPSLAVLALHGLLVVVSLGGLGLTGLGIDFIRHRVDASAAPPRWPIGFAPPSGWSAMQTVIAVAGAVLVLALLNTLVRYLAAVAVCELTQRMVVQLRTDVYDKLQRLSFGFFDAHQSSSIINRATADVQAVRMFVDGVLIRVLTVALTLGVYLAYMLSVHVPLTVACLITSPLLWWGAVAFSRLVQPAYVQSSKLGDEMVLTLAENVQGMHVVKGFARERQEIAKFEEANRRIKDQKESIFWKISTYQPVMGFVTQINMLVLLGYGGWLVIHGRLALGAGMFVFANLLHEFANQVGQITNVANTIQTSLTGAQRVFEVLDAPVQIESRPDAVPLPRARGSVRFERVCFAYRTAEETERGRDGETGRGRDGETGRGRDGETGRGRDGETGRQRDGETERGRDGETERGRDGATERQRDGETILDRDTKEDSHRTAGGALILNDIIFEARPGDCIGIVGETGAGKTTLLSLLARFYDATSGRVLIDGIDVRDLRLDDLRRNIGIVFQESFLFSNTVAANIAFGDPDAPPDRIEEAAAVAAADEFIAELPLGYDTIVGEYGANLSGGQRQRLAIARALLLDPPILVLDDATAAVDPETEHEIQAAVESAMRGRTTFLVSNRISALRRCDRILVMQKGRIIQTDTHDELVRQPGYYRRLAELQFADMVNDVKLSTEPPARRASA